MFKKSKKGEDESSRTLNVDASMQGDLIFKDPVDLKISGNFEGSLNTKGSLFVGENAEVNAEIKGENIKVAGKIVGNVKATSKIHLLDGAHVIGDIDTPSLVIEEGAFLQGNCHMIAEGGKSATEKKQIMDRHQLAEYLEVEPETVDEWIENRKIPAFKENNQWKFDKAKIDAWVASEKVK
jgi:excisionase family DNA binding protein